MSCVSALRSRDYKSNANGQTQGKRQPWHKETLPNPSTPLNQEHQRRRNIFGIYHYLKVIRLQRCLPRDLCCRILDDDAHVVATGERRKVQYLESLQRHSQRVDAEIHFLRVKREIHSLDQVNHHLHFVSVGPSSPSRCRFLRLRARCSVQPSM